MSRPTAHERILADLAKTRGWFCGSTWYATYLPTFSQRIGEINRGYARDAAAAGAYREGDVLIYSRVCRRDGHEHHGTIHEYALREWVRAEQLKLSA